MWTHVPIPPPPGRLASAMGTRVHASTSLKQLRENILPKKSGRKENTVPDVACQTQGPDAEGKTCSAPKHQGSPPPQ